MKCDTCEHRFKCLTKGKGNGAPLMVSLNENIIGYYTSNKKLIQDCKDLSKEIKELQRRLKAKKITIKSTGFGEAKYCGACKSWFSPNSDNFYAINQDKNVGFCKYKNNKESLMTHRYSTCDNFHGKKKKITLSDVLLMDEDNIKKDFDAKLARKNGKKPRYCVLDS